MSERSQSDVGYERLRSGLSWATVLLLTGCVVGIVLAVTVLDGDARIGPLSEWVPGTLTAVTLGFTLITQRRLDERQHAADERQRELERRQREQDAATLEAARRHQAERVFVWLERTQATYGSDTALLRWSNVSDGPAYLCSVTLIMSNDDEETVHLGTLPPHQPLGEVPLMTRITTGKRPGRATGSRSAHGASSETRKASSGDEIRAGRLSLVDLVDQP